MAMSDIKRYGIEETLMEEQLNGDYVLYEDYEALRTRIAETEARALEESNKYVAYCDLAEKRIAELTKGEPVAWMLNSGHGVIFNKEKPEAMIDYWKPLFLSAPIRVQGDPLTSAVLATIACDISAREGWISVSDRLPEEYEQVLITGISTSGAPLGVHMGELRDGWHFEFSEGCDPNLDENVTHWMELPKPAIEASKP